MALSKKAKKTAVAEKKVSKLMHTCAPRSDKTLCAACMAEK